MHTAKQEEAPPWQSCSSGGLLHSPDVSAPLVPSGSASEMNHLACNTKIKHARATAQERGAPIRDSRQHKSEHAPITDPRQPKSEAALSQIHGNTRAKRSYHKSMATQGRSAPITCPPVCHKSEESLITYPPVYHKSEELLSHIKDNTRARRCYHIYTCQSGAWRCLLQTVM